MKSILEKAIATGESQGHDFQAGARWKVDKLGSDFVLRKFETIERPCLEEIHLSVQVCLRP